MELACMVSISSFEMETIQRHELQNGSLGYINMNSLALIALRPGLQIT